jgi:hypothetical protein
MERQHDVLVSTLADYVSATGGELRLVAQYGDDEFEVEVPALRPARSQGDRRLRVIWQDPTTRQLLHVGSLQVRPTEYRFEYTAAARASATFEPFGAFPELDRRYRSDTLFPFFEARVPAASRASGDSLRRSLGLGRSEATPVELLARTGGVSPHDALQVVPEPSVIDGRLTVLFLASGVRHASAEDPRVERQIARLRPGAELDLVDEPTNEFNPHAICLRHRRTTLGWIPDYMVEEVHRLRATGSKVTVSVEQANGSEASWHLRLLCRLEAVGANDVALHADPG